MNRAMLTAAEKQARKWAASKGFMGGTSRERQGFRKSYKAYERKLVELFPQMTWREMQQVVHETVEMARRIQRPM